MRQALLLGLMVAFFGAVQGSLLEFAAMLPQCGLECILEQIPLSACKVVTNDTCICSDEGLKASVQTCLLERCNKLEAIEVARIEAQACKRPVRERKVDIMVPLILQITGILVVPLRLYARWTMMHRFEADDWIMMFCGVIFTVFVVLGQLAGAVAFGEDIWMVQPDELTLGLKLFFVDESFYLACLGLTKISVLFFYLRIFPNKSFRWATYATMAYIIISTTVVLLMQIFQCIPFEYNWLGWKGDFGPYHCLNINTLAFVAAGLSISHDMIILLLPLPLLWHLNTSRRTKMGIFFMFSLGVFILITSCIRLRYIVSFTRSLNPTWDFTDPLIWSGLEASVSMIVVCLPALRVLLKRGWPNMFSTIGTAEVNSVPKKASNTSSRGVYDVKPTDYDDNILNERQEEIADRKFAAREARAAKLAEKRRKFFSFRSTTVEPNESELELELGDKIRGEVRTQIRYQNGESATRRRSMESGIHVRTTTIFHDANRKPF
ncbi:CFEM domain-containing protein [Colletotrichum orchidophilum]|uniref:CFEM domain-containing protein n=1 Tax=Colletotrichum orchidophilum TaxID=1209926 RepID=A0A1G4B6X0_9PEZI|nr:CFEM domain-containing protein [Colletotrichum orchidophilum]OHE97032.1 CFEM domain-containing protein [Colletotrichum orchidophilum]